MKKRFIFVYLLIFIAELTALYFDSNWVFITKPLIMLSLIIYYLSNISYFNKKYEVFLIAMVFALLGDVFLIGNTETNFMLGLGSFLVMQLLYAYCFFKNKSTWKSANIILIVILLCFAIGFNILVNAKVGDLKLPVVFYSMAIMVMVFTGITRKKDGNSYMLIAIGVLSFLISDAFIGINKFTDHLDPKTASMAIMATYMVAQYLIVTGFTNATRKY